MLNDVLLLKKLDPVAVFCCIILFTPNEEDVEFNPFIPESLLLNDPEADRYLIGDYLNSDINKFIIPKCWLILIYFADLR
mgnify:CR=1 FL=1|jgi:hypothetical protein